ncbi:MAG: hypothetical protein U9N57_00665 [Pseudomonadota bacterium]|nr:hypothetical protein [Pseudomonadota bacterium]
MTLAPDKISLDKFSISGNYGKQLHLVDKINDNFNIDAFGFFREEAKRLIVLLPAAQPTSGSIVNPIFHRWSWYVGLEDCSVVSISDPSLYFAEINASWFISRDFDFIAEMSKFIRKISRMNNLEESQIIFYGSSMGGFASLMLASFFDEALSISEVPQLNFLNYPFLSAKHNVENKLLDGLTLDAFFQSYPERLDVVERFKKNRRIPSIKIITNTCDEGFDDLVNFTLTLSNLRKDVEVFGDFDVKVLSESKGHKPLDTPIGLKVIRSAISDDWSVNKCNQQDIELSKPSYKNVLDKAIENSKLVKYIRTEEDEMNYKKALRGFYQAAEMNVSADWPFLKVCSMVKLWSNSFNVELFESSKKALERKESLEGFIYFCRGALYNLDVKDALSSIVEMMKSIKDPIISNVGNIFTAICAYQIKDYETYREYIANYQRNSSEDFKPYISIPVSTVYLGKESAPKNYGIENVTLLGEKLQLPEFKKNTEKYIVSISCDLKYLKIYGKYLVQSFSKFCSVESMMHIAVLSNDEQAVEDVSLMLKSWGSENIVFSCCKLDVRENIGPTASLIRFSYIYPLIKKYNLPVVVLDLDTLLKKPLLELVEKHRGSDVCSRILGNGVAPWEKYTGGFSIFYPTDVATKIAKNIAYVADKSCGNECIQWWIDQNCFEAGIRLSLEGGEEPIIENVISERDAYCVMPVGSQDSKLFTLDKALDAILD